MMWESFIEDVKQYVLFSDKAGRNAATHKPLEAVAYLATFVGATSLVTALWVLLATNLMAAVIGAVGAFVIGTIMGTIILGIGALFLAIAAKIVSVDLNVGESFSLLVFSHTPTFLILFLGAAFAPLLALIGIIMLISLYNLWKGISSAAKVDGVKSAIVIIVDVVLGIGVTFVLDLLLGAAIMGLVGGLGAVAVATA
ncbi:MAG: hypothetical protein D6769_01115 [Methanobacteriota archaeon]|nr:MAG: hypothetical protein D6769_01115 [Euryarchaeota archaeon]